MVPSARWRYLCWKSKSILDRVARCRADLVALDEEKKIAYLKLSGWCQGCSMSRMTLTQGIETMLREAIPNSRRYLTSRITRPERTPSTRRSKGCAGAPP